VTYLDTHVAAWLYGGHSSNLSKTALREISNESLRISPMVLLELQLLFETRRAKDPASTVAERLARDLGVTVCDHPFQLVAASAMEVNWTRDPFDRLIVAHAAANDAPLLTKDEKMRRHYKRAIW
jgi:PIN domain nuclease of toxin-antitoxin system